MNKQDGQLNAEICHPCGCDACVSMQSELVAEIDALKKAAADYVNKSGALRKFLDRRGIEDARKMEDLQSKLTAANEIIEKTESVLLELRGNGFTATTLALAELKAWRGKA
jgi:cytochrome c551/c552